MEIEEVRHNLFLNHLSLPDLVRQARSFQLPAKILGQIHKNSAAAAMPVSVVYR
jgi:hypothetical protein